MRILWGSDTLSASKYNSFRGEMREIIDDDMLLIQIQDMDIIKLNTNQHNQAFILRGVRAITRLCSP